MSDLYSDLNLKEGTKIVLGDSGVSISSSGSVVLDSGCTTSLGDIATKAYIDSCLSGVVTTESFSDECVAGAAYLDGEKIDVCTHLIIGSGTACVALKGSNIHLEAVSGEIVFDADYDIRFSKTPVTWSTSGYVNLATEKYVNEAISGIESSGGTVSGDYLPATQDESGCYYIDNNVNVKEKLTFVCATELGDPVTYAACGSISVNDPLIGINVLSNHGVNLCSCVDVNISAACDINISASCIKFEFHGTNFKFPQKTSCSCEYIIATTDDIVATTDDVVIKNCTSSQYVCGKLEIEEIKTCTPIAFASTQVISVSDNGSVFYVPEKTGGCYTLATTDDLSSCSISGDYLPATKEDSGCYFVEEDVYFTHCVGFGCCLPSGLMKFGAISTSYYSSGKKWLTLESVGSTCIAAPNGCIVFQQKDAVFSFPANLSGVYSLVVKEETSSPFPTSYEIYTECTTSGIKAGAVGYCSQGIPTFEEGCGSGIYFCAVEYLAIHGCAGVSLHTGDPSHGCGYTTYVPAKFPYSPCSSSAFCATIVTSPGYDSSGCGLQICVLSQSDYDAMCEHGMTTLYFIKG